MSNLLIHLVSWVSHACHVVSHWFQAGFKGFMHLPRISMHQVHEIARLPRILPRLPRVFATPANDSRGFLPLRLAMWFDDFSSGIHTSAKAFATVQRDFGDAGWPRSRRSRDTASTRLRRGLVAVLVRSRDAFDFRTSTRLRRGLDACATVLRFNRGVSASRERNSLHRSCACCLA